VTSQQSRFRPIITILLLLALTASRSGLAQSVISPARRCDRADTTTSWYRQQRDWWALDAKHDWTDDTLRNVLIGGASRLEPKSAAEFPLQLGGAITPHRSEPVSPDIAPLRQRLRDMAAKRSWPVRSLVGPAGVRAAWVIARGDSVLSGIAMHRMMEAGPGEVSPADVAVLEDWMRLQNGRKQIYATQLIPTRDARSKPPLQPAPTEDLTHVDLRRDAAGLPPLAFALCVALHTRP
jgi:hypothetical protein